MDVGAALRDAREQRRLSVDQLSRTTKISVATLRAIEKNEIDKLPGGIFIRGFLRAYAREVGLDVEDTVQRYLAQFEPRPNEGVPIETDDTWLEPTPAVHRETNIDEAGQRAASGRLLFVGLALAIGLAGYLAFHGSGTPAPPSEAPAERAANEALPPSTVPGPVETATSGSYDANAPATRRQDVVLLDIRTLGPCWVSATADGLSVVYRLMQAGERQTIEARDEVVLRIGDPAAFTFFINNMPGRTLGRAGQAVTLRSLRRTIVNSSVRRNVVTLVQGGTEMPVYEFVCRDCQKPFEIIRPMSEAQATDVKCPACGSGRVDRTYSHVYAKTSKKS